MGFRPCLRCRPELAPGHAPVDAVRRTAQAAASRIEAGALNDGGSLDELAANLGLSARQLRRAVKQEFGVSPIELAQTQRLLLAKQLLSESNLPDHPDCLRERFRERPALQRLISIALPADAERPAARWPAPPRATWCA